MIPVANTDALRILVLWTYIYLPNPCYLGPTPTRKDGRTCNNVSNVHYPSCPKASTAARAGDPRSPLTPTRLCVFAATAVQSAVQSARCGGCWTAAALDEWISFLLPDGVVLQDLCMWKFLYNFFSVLLLFPSVCWVYLVLGDGIPYVELSAFGLSD
jgi:hypothetical protein